jgi:hypothetical protein
MEEILPLLNRFGMEIYHKHEYIQQREDKSSHVHMIGSYLHTILHKHIPDLTMNLFCYHIPYLLFITNCHMKYITYIQKYFHCLFQIGHAKVSYKK